jgi:hypothetical protein
MAELKHPHSEVPANLPERRREIIRREVNLHWQRFSEDTLLEISAARDACLNFLYEKYGYAREQVEGDLDQILRSLGTRHAKIRGKPSGKQIKGRVRIKNANSSRSKKTEL